ncbi:penicillin binding transpeptidase domain protein [Rickettsia endosymbiont of Ixodes pacificus]|nr:penicillin binding transpeptidase domain protein [Rickettsia endosymbiont of Ixodes pacificus]
MKTSCVWYSQVITKELGIEKFRDYVTKFDYGNRDISGDKGKNNGLTNAGLSSSLEISPEEQLAFLQKLAENKLPVSVKAQEMTKNILFIEDFRLEALR